MLLVGASSPYFSFTGRKKIRKPVLNFFRGPYLTDSTPKDFSACGGAANDGCDARDLLPPLTLHIRSPLWFEHFKLVEDTEEKFRGLKVGVTHWWVRRPGRTFEERSDQKEGRTERH